MLWTNSISSREFMQTHFSEGDILLLTIRQNQSSFKILLLQFSLHKQRLNVPLKGEFSNWFIKNVPLAKILTTKLSVYLKI